MGVRIEHVFETHNHADHVSGHGRLAAATGAEHEPFEDGAEFALGELRVRALHTPGHRPEHTAFALIDLRRGEEPWAVLTGDFGSKLAWLDARPAGSPLRSASGGRSGNELER